MSHNSREQEQNKPLKVIKFDMKKPLDVITAVRAMVNNTKFYYKVISRFEITTLNKSLDAITTAMAT